jgi:hypothetical protein
MCKYGTIQVCQALRLTQKVNHMLLTFLDSGVNTYVNQILLYFNQFTLTSKNMFCLCHGVLCVDG